MLIYLQMTDHQDFPKDELLEYSGNFVSSGMDGTICLGRDIFWDKYLLRRSTPRLLPTFNEYTYAWVSDYSIPNNMACSWDVKMESGHVSDTSFTTGMLIPKIPWSGHGIPTGLSSRFMTFTRKTGG